jgi:hypothetical protein
MKKQTNCLRMKTTLYACLFFAALTPVPPVGAQGTFQNLDFESARIVYSSPNLVGTTNALPGWVAFYGTNQMLAVRYNSPAGINPVGLVGSNVAVISGSFSVILETDGDLRQTGVVPADANSLFFKARWAGVLPVLTVALGGQSLSLTALSSTTNYTLFGAGISGFAGQTAVLSCSLADGRFVIDDFEFSPVVIPEPGVVGLVWLGASCLAASMVRRRFRRDC